MPPASVVFDSVSKKFRRGERHDSLRDLIPAAVGKLLNTRPPVRELEGSEFWALRNVSFEVVPGEALGIIGPNGAGKSTALKLLTRILKPTIGHCSVVGRTGALIELAAGFHPDLTGRENVYLQGAIMGMKRVEITTRFDEIVHFANIHDFIDTPVKRYSSGMNARLGFSIAAHLNPDVLLVDEVLAVGDAAFQDRSYERMLQFRKEGVAIVFVSHNLAAIRTLCDRVLLLRNGETQVLDTPSVAFNEYANLQRTRDDPSSAQGGSPEAFVEIVDERSQPTELFYAGATVVLHASVALSRWTRPIASAIRVRRVDMGDVVYFTTTTALGDAAHVPQNGRRMEVRWSFRANLAKGQYSVELVLLDAETSVVVLRLNPAGYFGVTEEETSEGIAFLNAKCSMSNVGER